MEKTTTECKPQTCTTDAPVPSSGADPDPAASGEVSEIPPELVGAIAMLQICISNGHEFDENFLNMAMCVLYKTHGIPRTLSTSALLQHLAIRKYVECLNSSIKVQLMQELITEDVIKNGCHQVSNPLCIDNDGNITPGSESAERKVSRQERRTQERHASKSEGTRQDSDSTSEEKQIVIPPGAVIQVPQTLIASRSGSTS